MAEEESKLAEKLESATKFTEEELKNRSYFNGICYHSKTIWTIGC